MAKSAQPVTVDLEMSAAQLLARAVDGGDLSILQVAQVKALVELVEAIKLVGKDLARVREELVQIRANMPPRQSWNTGVR